MCKRQAERALKIGAVAPAALQRNVCTQHRLEGHEDLYQQYIKLVAHDLCRETTGAEKAAGIHLVNVVVSCCRMQLCLC